MEISFTPITVMSSQRSTESFWHRVCVMLCDFLPYGHQMYGECNHRRDCVSILLVHLATVTTWTDYLVLAIYNGMSSSV